MFSSNFWFCIYLFVRSQCGGLVAVKRYGGNFFIRSKMERAVIKVTLRLLKILINETELSGEFEGGQGCKVCAAES